MLQKFTSALLPAGYFSQLPKNIQQEIRQLITEERFHEAVRFYREASKQFNLSYETQ